MKKVISLLCIAAVSTTALHADFILKLKNNTQVEIDGKVSFAQKESGEWAVSGSDINVEDIDLITYKATGGSTIADAFAGGDGTESNPFLVSNSSELCRMAYVVNEYNNGSLNDGVDYSSAYYKLTDDIDMTGISDWTPIGTGRGNENLQRPENNLFKGHLDGDGFSIANFTPTFTAEETEACFGLFGVLCGEVSNLEIEGDITAVQPIEEGYSVMLGAFAGLVSNGTINNCEFVGSCRATYPEGKSGVAMVGGMTGNINSGLITNCTVTIPEGSELFAIGYNLSVGGIVGYGYTGTANGCIVKAAGKITAKIDTKYTDNEILNGANAYAGGIVGMSFGSVLSNVTADISGEILAESLVGAEGLTETANAGGIAGSYSADYLSSGSVNISGTIIARANSATNSAGAVASQTGGYGANGLTITIKPTATLQAETPEESTSYSSSASAAVGGVYGRWSNVQGGGGLSDCSAAIEGTLKGSHPSAVYVGGIIGNAVSMTRCYVVMSESAVIDVKSGSGPAIVGGLCGNIATGNVRGCYFIGNGTINVLSNSMANFGGLAGSAGSRLKKATLTGCYAIIKNSVEVSATRSATVGGLTGTTYGNLNSCYWYSSTDAINGHNPSGESDDMKLESTSREDFETIAASMNEAIEEYGVYDYSEELGYLTISRPIEE